MFLDTSYEIVTPPENVLRELKKYVSLYDKGVCRIIPGNLYHTKALQETVLPKIHKMKFHSSDVFICCYPRSGSTWTQELAWAMIHNPNLNHKESQGHAYEKAYCIDLDATLAVNGYPNIIKDLFEKYQASSFLDCIKQEKSPKILKTHLFIDLLPKSAQENCKFIYLIRNPLNACVSFYHFCKDVKFFNFKGDLDEFVDLFITGNFHLGSYLEHIKCWNRLKHRPNILTVFYEELRKDAYGHLKKLDSFLETNLSDQQIDNVLHYCSFEEMTKRDPLHQSEDVKVDILTSSDSHGFLRTGNDRSQEELTDEQKRKLKKHFRDNLGDIKLPYDFSD